MEGGILLTDPSKTAKMCGNRGNTKRNETGKAPQKTLTA